MTNNNRIALAMISILTDPDNDPDSLNACALRSLLIDPDAPDSYDPTPYDTILADCIRALDTQSLSMLLLDYSLCPLHRIDYAICFDDRDPDCAAIRDTFPNHDT